MMLRSLTCCLLAVAAAQTADPLAPARPLTADDLELELQCPLDPRNVETRARSRKFDLGERKGLRALRQAVQGLNDLAELQDEYGKAHPERYLPFPTDVSSGGKRRALRESLRLVDEWLGGTPSTAAQLRLLELVRALQNSFRYPVERDHQLIPEILPGLLLKSRSRRVVARSAGQDADPAPSSFWAPSGDAREKDLYAGFGRAEIPRFSDVTCEYRAPKTGWGAHPGFHVKCGAAELRFKLGDERWGGPFNTRVFDALGYNTHPIDAAPDLRIAYDRRVLTEFHSRRRLSMQARLLFIPLKTHLLTDEDDPFDHVDYALTKDGRRIPAAELRGRLLQDTTLAKGRPRPETVDANYRSDYEATLQALVWKPGTFAWESDDVRQIGAWDYDQLDHAERREVRAVFVLAAWVDQHNMRWENTRLAWVKREGAWELRHLFSDIGSGLGFAGHMLKGHNSDVEAMAWEVTQRDGDRVRFFGFVPNVDNDAFQRLTWQDARWMLRKIAAFSEGQLKDALLATGMSAAEVRLALEKLLSKRRKMLSDFDLLPEFPEIAERRIDRSLSFDPRDPAQLARVSRTRPDGTRVTPPLGDSVVVGGHLLALSKQP